MVFEREMKDMITRIISGVLVTTKFEIQHERTRARGGRAKLSWKFYWLDHHLGRLERLCKDYAGRLSAILE